MVCGSCRTFLIAPLRRYRYIYCGIPTGGCRQNNNERAAIGRPFFDNVAVSTADLITPHPSPKVTPSPQAPQGEDNGLRRETQHRTRVTQNNTVSAAPSTPGTGKFSAALALRETTRFPPRLRHRDTGNKCIRRCAKSPLKIKTASHCCCAMQLWFIPMFRTGTPESSAPHLRYARQPRFPPQPRHRATGKFSAVLALREATTVSSATSTPGYQR